MTLLGGMEQFVACEIESMNLELRSLSCSKSNIITASTLLATAQCLLSLLGIFYVIHVN